MNHQKYQRKLMMTENKKNQEFKIRKIKRNIERSCDNAIKYFELFVVFFVAGLLLWHGMHAFFSAGIDSWKADPELNNFRYMWNILMYVIPYTLWAFAAGFLVTSFLSPMYELIFGNIMIFLLKRRMRRENKLREGGNNASH
ncbi:TPA: F-type conjugal transfer protein TrbF [Escherichia coli]|nr:F-type conjugal transfer protein TrbF [Escherichia coli]